MDAYDASSVTTEYTWRVGKKGSYLDKFLCRSFVSQNKQEPTFFNML